MEGETRERQKLNSAMSDPYTLRYVELPIARIFNWLAPKNVTCWLNVPEWRDTWWSEETVELRNQFEHYWIEAFDDITGHFTKLRESIKKDGILRPVSTVSGIMRGRNMASDKCKAVAYAPPEYHNNIDNLVYTQPFGGSRIVVAEELGIDMMPCVVHDFTNIFSNAPEVTATNYRTWFGDEYMFRASAPRLIVRHQSHLMNDKQFSMMNDHTRKAQKRATAFAKEKLNV